MGTRCITVIEDEDGNELCRIFRKFDGYPAVHGEALVSFLNRGVVTELLHNLDDSSWLGMGDVATSLVAFLKSYSSVGGKNAWRAPISSGNQIALMPVGTKDIGEAYIYTVSYQGNKKNVEVRVVDLATKSVEILLS